MHCERREDDETNYNPQKSIKRRLAILGFGHLGRYLLKWARGEDTVEAVLVYNRRLTPELQELRQLGANGVAEVTVITGEDEEDINDGLIAALKLVKPDIVVEVSHPDVVAKYGRGVLEICDFMICSPSALGDEQLEKGLREACVNFGHGLYVPAGALWGFQDIRKMADNDSIESLTVTMRKHVDSLKLTRTNVLLEDGRSEVVIYDGPVRHVCSLAPNNVNTMAAAAIAAHTLGFDKTRGILIADKNMANYHVIEIEVIGKKKPGSTLDPFHCYTRRINPAPLGQVTGEATFQTFPASLKGAQGKGSGFHLC